MKKKSKAKEPGKVVAHMAVERFGTSGLLILAWVPGLQPIERVKQLAKNLQAELVRTLRETS